MRLEPTVHVKFFHRVKCHFPNRSKDCEPDKDHCLFCVTAVTEISGLDIRRLDVPNPPDPRVVLASGQLPAINRDQPVFRFANARQRPHGVRTRFRSTEAMCLRLRRGRTTRVDHLQ